MEKKQQSASNTRIYTHWSDDLEQFLFIVHVRITAIVRKLQQRRKVQAKGKLPAHRVPVKQSTLRESKRSSKRKRVSNLAHFPHVMNHRSSENS